MKPELLDLIKEFTKDVVLKTKVQTFTAPNHGSSCGEDVELTLYWNEYKIEWTSKESALEGIILKQLRPYIREAVK